MVSAFDLPLVQAGMHGLYTGHITHGTRFGMKYYAKNVVPVFCVSCASVNQRGVHQAEGGGAQRTLTPPGSCGIDYDVFPSTAVPGCPLLPLQLRAADRPALLLRVAHRQREVGLGARGAGFWGTRRHCIGHPGTTSRRTSSGTGSGTTRWSSTSRSAASSPSTSTLKPCTKVLSI